MIASGVDTSARRNRFMICTNVLPVDSRAAQHFGKGDPVSCAKSAKDNNLLEETSWKLLPSSKKLKEVQEDGEPSSFEVYQAKYVA